MWKITTVDICEMSCCGAVHLALITAQHWTERERERMGRWRPRAGWQRRDSLLAGPTCRSANTGAQYEIPQSVANICHCPHHCFLLRHFSPVVTLTAAPSNQPTRPTTSQTLSRPNCPVKKGSERRRS